MATQTLEPWTHVVALGEPTEQRVGDERVLVYQMDEHPQTDCSLARCGVDNSPS